jgi:nucleoside-diphosphate-sugar epimerase
MADEAALDHVLSTPTAAVVETLRRLPGDFLILGVGGKMGPSLVGLLSRASAAAGSSRRVTVVARFSDPAARALTEAAGATVYPADLLEPAAVERLPEAPNVIYMVGQKFGTGQDAARTWAINAYLPGLVAARYPAARIAVYSTGNVYPFWPTGSAGPTETDPTGPVGEYAQSALARERIFSFFSERNQTPVAILRINYAIEPRYGVIRDIADRVRAREPVDLGMGQVNVIWQRDANAIAIQSLAAASVPPCVVNVTGRPAVSVRAIAESFGRRWSIVPVFSGTPQPTALLSNAEKSDRLFGPPATSLDQMIDHIATWIEAGGRSLAKPTHFAERDGNF